MNETISFQDVAAAAAAEDELAIDEIPLGSTQLQFRTTLNGEISWSERQFAPAAYGCDASASRLGQSTEYAKGHRGKLVDIDLINRIQFLSLLIAVSRRDRSECRWLSLHDELIDTAQIRRFHVGGDVQWAIRSRPWWTRTHLYRSRRSSFRVRQVLINESSMIRKHNWCLDSSSVHRDPLFFQSYPQLHPLWSETIGIRLIRCSPRSWILLYSFVDR